MAKGPSSGIQGGLIYYRRLQWSGSNPVWYDINNWQPGPDSAPTYRDYYDIPQNGTNAAPHTGGTVALGDTGSRLMMAVIRNGYLYTSHHVGLDGGANSTYDGGTVDRSAIQWFKLQVATGGLSYSIHKRIYDTDTGSSPNWYYNPSLNVNASGDMVVGFSGSKTGEAVGGFFFGYKHDGTLMPRPMLVQAGRAAFVATQWGDYSATIMDPNDDSFWTVQEHASYDLGIQFPAWGTWVTQVQVMP